MKVAADPQLPETQTDSFETYAALSKAFRPLQQQDQSKSFQSVANLNVGGWLQKAWLDYGLSSRRETVESV